MSRPSEPNRLYRGLFAGTNQFASLHRETWVSGDLGIWSCSHLTKSVPDPALSRNTVASGMIFIPCRGGVSHRPDEYSSLEAIARGVEVLALTLAGLADAGE